MTQRVATELATPSADRRVVVDSAGATKGGAARFLREFRAYLADEVPSGVEMIGLDRQLTPSWLVRRELMAVTADLRISLNNAGFISPRGTNVTLLRNILQFATEIDLEKLAFTPPRRLRAQTPVVRTLAKASAVLVVPCTRMAEQVSVIAPSLEEKLTVRFHPVSKPSWAGSSPKYPRDVLLPIVPSPYKNLDEHIPEFLKASEGLPGETVRLIVPATPSVLPGLASHPRVHFIGPQTSQKLDRWWQDCGAVFFPVEFESFGYALAESRVYGRSIIAQDTAQNHEIAGSALSPYTRHDDDSLRTAIRIGTDTVPVPDPDPFDPASYFAWLLDGATKHAATENTSSKGKIA